jgi:hypothetical protein
MQTIKTLYLYPFTKATTQVGGNTYNINVRKYLGEHFNIINTQTNLGLLDVVLKLPRCNVLYFNWIEDVADKKFATLQVLLLHAIVWFSKRTNIKIVWFVHNNLSHKKRNLALKKQVVELMSKNADVILTHSAEAKINSPGKNVFVFEHPVDAYKPVQAKQVEYDLLVWGTVNPYKGVEEFLAYNQSANALKQYKILIAGKFVSSEYFEKLMRLKSPNVFVENKILSEEELEERFSKSRYVLFTYNSTSVLSSAALCKTLIYGKTIIGPNAGSFKELGAKGLIYNYKSFEDLENRLDVFEPRERDAHFQLQLQQYIKQHSWPAFASFAAEAINRAKKPALQHVL